MLIHPNIAGGLPDHFFGGTYRRSRWSKLISHNRRRKCQLTHNTFGQGGLAAEATVAGDVLAAGPGSGASTSRSALMITTGLVLGLAGFHVATRNVITGSLSTLAPLVLLTSLGVALHSTGIRGTGPLVELAASRVITREVGISILALLTSLGVALHSAGIRGTGPLAASGVITRKVGIGMLALLTSLGVALHSTGIRETGPLVELAASGVITRKVGIGTLPPLLAWVVLSVAGVWVWVTGIAVN
jgi:hypothetical protein